MYNITHEYNIESAIHVGNLQINVHTGASSTQTAWSPQDRPALLRFWASPSLLSTSFFPPRLWLGKSGQRGLPRRQEVISTSQTILRLISASSNPTLSSSGRWEKHTRCSASLTKAREEEGLPPPPTRERAHHAGTNHSPLAGSWGAERRSGAGSNEGGRRGRAEVGWHLGPSH